MTINNYIVSWWCYSGKEDDYVDYSQEITASSEENAIEIIRSIDGFIYRAGKNWKAEKI